MHGIGATSLSLSKVSEPARARTEHQCCTSSRCSHGAVSQHTTCSNRFAHGLHPPDQIPAVLWTRPRRQARLVQAYSGNDNGADWGPQPNPAPKPNDPVSIACQRAYAMINFLVANLSDMLQSVAVRGAPRAAIENSVRGALALLSLWLLQEVVGTVLLLGTVLLTLYAASQVFGMQLPDVGSFGNGGDTGQAPPPGDHGYGARQQGPGSFADSAYGSYGGTFGGRRRQAPYGAGGAQQQQQQPGGNAPPYGRRAAWRSADPVVDVYYEDLSTARPHQAGQQPPTQQQQQQQQQEYGWRR